MDSKEKSFEAENNWQKKGEEKLKNDIMRQMKLANIRRELEQENRMGQVAAEAKKMMQAKFANLMSSYKQQLSLPKRGAIFASGLNTPASAKYSLQHLQSLHSMPTSMPRRKTSDFEMPQDDHDEDLQHMLQE